jgi:hypothetical protein
VKLYDKDGNEYYATMYYSKHELKNKLMVELKSGYSGLFKEYKLNLDIITDDQLNLYSEQLETNADTALSNYYSDDYYNNLADEVLYTTNPIFTLIRFYAYVLNEDFVTGHNEYDERVEVSEIIEYIGNTKVAGLMAIFKEYDAVNKCHSYISLQSDISEMAIECRDELDAEEIEFVFDYLFTDSELLNNLKLLLT